jgi:hypothetical protein
MKFTASIILSAVGLALATPTIEVRGPTLTERDLGTFTSVIASIDSAVKSFDSAVQAYSGGAATSVLSAGNGVTSTTNSGITAINSQPDLNESDALQLTAPVQGLTTDIQTAINDLIAKKTQIVAAGAGGQVELALQAQYTAAGNLANAISSKVPSSLAPIASQLASGITAAIQKGITAFQGTGSSSSSASSASSTASQSSGSSSASATATVTSSVAVSSKPAATSSVSVPKGSNTTSTGKPSPPLFTNGAASNNIGGPVGLIAALAAVLAF